MNIRRLFLRAKSVAEESPASQAKAKVSSKPESDSDSYQTYCKYKASKIVIYSKREFDSNNKEHFRKWCLKKWFNIFCFKWRVTLRFVAFESRSIYVTRYLHDQSLIQFLKKLCRLTQNLLRMILVFFYSFNACYFSL